MFAYAYNPQVLRLYFNKTIYILCPFWFNICQVFIIVSIFLMVIYIILTFQQRWYIYYWIGLTRMTKMILSNSMQLLRLVIKALQDFTFSSWVTWWGWASHHVLRTLNHPCGERGELRLQPTTGINLSVSWARHLGSKYSSPSKEL